METEISSIVTTILLDIFTTRNDEKEQFLEKILIDSFFNQN